MLRGPMSCHRSLVGPLDGIIHPPPGLEALYFLVYFYTSQRHVAVCKQECSYLHPEFGTTKSGEHRGRAMGNRHTLAGTDNQHG